MTRLDAAPPSSASIPPNGVVKSPNVCWRYMQGSYCPEELCHYQHGPPLQAARLPRRTAASYGRTACLFFAQGYCKHGEKCTFAHIPLGAAPQSDITGANYPGPPFSSPTEVIHAPPTTPGYPTNHKNLKNARPDYRTQDLAPHVREPTSAAADPGYRVGWTGQDSDEDDLDMRGRQYLDKSRSRQVYDDKKVLVLSGGVMLGRPDQPQERSRSPSGRPRHSAHPQVPPLSIHPYTMMPSGAVPPLVSSASSSFSSGDHLTTPVEWPYSAPWTDYDDSARAVGMAPAFVPGMAPTPWAYGFPPQSTTITMAPQLPPTSRRSRRERASHQAPADYPLPLSPEADITAAFSTLQVSAPPKSDGYASDDGAGTGTSRESSPSPTAPFRRSSLGAVVELSGKRESVSKAILREPHATHRRGRPSM